MTKTTTIVGLGEILWDVLPDGPRLGGAPTNFASSVAGLAPNSSDIYIVSSVGNDDLGQRATTSLKASGVKTSFVAVQNKPTGQVFVKLDSKGCASYEFAADTAWDNLVWPNKPTNELEQLALRTDAVCFGTLGQRSEPSRQTIQQFVSTMPTDSLRICDINLRPPFFSDTVILESLALANVLKLSDEELPKVASVCGFTGSTSQMIEQLASRFQFQMVALTRGSEGAILYRGDQISKQPAIKTEVVDTVGAGDAFTATLVLGMLAGHPLDTINQNASKVAAFVCSQPGAAPKMPSQFQNVF